MITFAFKSQIYTEKFPWHRVRNACTLDICATSFGQVPIEKLAEFIDDQNFDGCVKQLVTHDDYDWSLKRHSDGTVQFYALGASFSMQWEDCKQVFHEFLLDFSKKQ